MAQFNNAMEIFQLLPRTNCRECNETTCLAFAGAVFTGKRGLSDCPFVDRDMLEKYGGEKKGINPVEEEFDEVFERLQRRLSEQNFKERANILQAEYSEGTLQIPILGKPFRIDNQCNVTTDIHVNNWVLGSVLHYVIHCKGNAVSSNWVPLRELPGGKDWYRLFGKQCEEILKDTADSYPDLFSDLVGMFRGRVVDDQFKSDVAVILMPLPLVPMLICYWQPEDGMESSLNLFFDDTAEANLGMEGLYTLGVGIAMMLEKMSMVHGTK